MGQNGGEGKEGFQFEFLNNFREEATISEYVVQMSMRLSKEALNCSIGGGGRKSDEWVVQSKKLPPHPPSAAADTSMMKTSSSPSF